MRVKMIKNDLNWIQCTVSTDVIGNSQSPFVVSKIEDSKKMIQKVGLPGEFLKIQAERTKK